MTASPTRRHRLAAVLVASLAAIPAALAVAPAAVGSTAAHRAAATTTGGQLPGSAVHTITRLDPRTSATAPSRAPTSRPTTGPRRSGTRW